jgi:hypothetical protein
VGSEILLEQVQLNFSFLNKFIILLLCALLVDNNTFSKMCVLKDLPQSGMAISPTRVALTRLN